MARLREFGLSEYAARAYLALLDLGVSEARDISTLSKVPTSKIYHVLEQLHEKGLVEILPEFPKRYAPVSFETFLAKVLSEHRAAVESLEQDRDALVEMFSVKGDVDLGERGSFTIIRGRRNVLAEFRDITESSREELLIFGGEGAGLRARLYAPTVAGAVARGVRLRLLVPVTPGNLESVEEMAPYVEVRHRDVPTDRQVTGVSIGVADNRKAIIAHFIPDDANTTRGEDTAIATDDPGMIAALRAILDSNWLHAVPLEGRRQELLHNRPRAFSEIVRDAAGHGDRLLEAVGRASGTLDLVAPTGLLLSSPRVLEAVEAAGVRGVSVRALLHGAPRELASLLARLVAAGAEAREGGESVRAFLCVVDGASGLLAPVGAEGDDVGCLFTTEAAFVDTLGAAFASRWNGPPPAAPEAAAQAQRAERLMGEAPVREAFREFWQGAREHVIVITDAPGLAAWAAPEVRERVAAGDLRLRLATEVTPDNLAAAEALAAFAEVRHVPRVFLNAGLADGREALFMLPRALPNEGAEGAPGAMWVRSADVLHLATVSAAFETAWQSAVPLAARVADLAGGMAVPPSPVR